MRIVIEYALSFLPFEVNILSVHLFYLTPSLSLYLSLPSPPLFSFPLSSPSYFSEPTSFFPSSFSPTSLPHFPSSYLSPLVSSFLFSILSLIYFINLYQEYRINRKSESVYYGKKFAGHGVR